MEHSPRDTALARCDEQILWFTNSAGWMRWWHYGTQLALLVITSTIPLLSVFHSNPSMFQAILGFLAALLVGVNGLFHFQEKWVVRGATMELLKSERLRFLTRTGSHYDQSRSEDQALNTFVERIEAIGMRELGEWERLHKAGKGESGG